MPGNEADATTDTEKDKDLIAIDVKSILLLRCACRPISLLCFSMR